ncbi:hypothetical protein [Tunturiibacter lichenicola]|uniref:hypothetical protein n=1 Tax=Tunturiibacter lichenicola TaxID=2051959 RepID=UPI003D9AED8F
MVGDGVEALKIFGVDVWVVLVLFAGGVVCYIARLVREVIGVSDAMFVVSAVPDLSCDLLACCEGVSALEVLNAFCC